MLPYLEGPAFYTATYFSVTKKAYFPFVSHKILASTALLTKRFTVPFHEEHLISFVLNTAPARFI